MSNNNEETETYQLKYIMFTLEEENLQLNEDEIARLKTFLPSFQIISTRWFHSPMGWINKELIFARKDDVLSQTSISLPHEDNLKMNERRKCCKETDIGLPVLYYPRYVDATYLSTDETNELYDGLHKILPSSTVMWMHFENDE